MGLREEKKLIRDMKVGQIWQVTTENFFTSLRNEAKIGKTKRQIKLNNGEFIEIRYPFCWHFRTTDNEYYHAEPEMILQNCVLVGEILENIRFKNKANLEEIMRLELYKPA